MINKTENKIAFLLSSLKFGGGERVALNLALELKSQGYQVDFLLMSMEGEFLTEAKQHFNVVNLFCNRTWKLPLKLAVYLWRERPMGLITSFWKLNLCGCLARIMYPSVKLAVWEHSPPSRSNNSPTALYAITASLFYRLATCVVAVSRGVRDDVASITIGLQSRMEVIFNAIPPPFDCVNSQRPKEMGFKRIIWVGRLNEPKNPALMLEAFACVAKEKPVVLEFVGDGPYRADLEARTKALGLLDLVSFLGFKSNPYPYMQAADLLVLTSDSEGLGNVLVEAMYCGLPVVCTDCGAGVHDILLNNVYGTIVPLGDTDALVKAISKALVFPVDAHKQILGAQRFRPELIAIQFLQSMDLRILK